MTAEQNALTVEGKKPGEAAREYVYQGIAARPFRRVFNLADYVRMERRGRPKSDRLPVPPATDIEDVVPPDPVRQERNFWTQRQGPHQGQTALHVPKLTVCDAKIS